MKRLFLGAAMTMVMMLQWPSTMGAQTNQAVQTIKGQVCDVASGEPIVGVTITVENGMTMSTVSDIEGNFIIKNVPVGRHSVRATYIGYEPVLLKDRLTPVCSASRKPPAMLAVWPIQHEQHLCLLVLQQVALPTASLFTATRLRCCNGV